MLVSLRNLATFPFVDAAVRSGILTLHGAFVDIGTGALLVHGPDGFAAG